jgi:uncharacterized protein YutE (UPF0331/DUF86 family)
LVDAELAGVRLLRLEETLERLQEVRSEGEDFYLSHSSQRAATERWLQVAIQICIDLGTQLVKEQSVAAPTATRGFSRRWPKPA